MRLRLVLLVILIVVLAGGIFFLWKSPHVTDASPKDGANGVAAGAPIRLTFSHAMQPETVIQRLTTDPIRQIEYHWEGDTLVLSVSQPWPSGGQITVQLAAGAKAAGFPPLPVLQGYRWSFTIENPLLAYLYPWDGTAQVYLVNPQSGESQQLTHSLEAVLDYDINVTGSQIFYSASQSNGDSAIYRLDRTTGQVDTLVNCSKALCRSPKVSPKEDFLAYERTDLSGSSPEDFPQVWIIPLGDTPGTPRLAGDPTHRTQQPGWSPSGQLTYYDSTQTAYVIEGINSQATRQIPSQAGLPGAWNPDGSSFVYPEIFNSTSSISSTLSGVDILPSTHLIQFSLSDSTSIDLTVQENLEDVSPLFSPDGSQLAFARRFLDIQHWTPGRQLWMMDSDGENARQLTQEPDFNHYDFAWSLDSKQLAYTRFNNNILTEPPEIWTMQADGSGARRLLAGGYAPRWIP